MVEQPEQQTEQQALATDSTDSATPDGASPGTESTHETNPAAQSDDAPAENVASTEESAASAVGENTDGEPEDEEKKKNALPEFPVAKPVEIKSQEDLDEAIKSHSAWMKGVLSPRVAVAEGRANLSNADLSQLNLTGVNLTSANLSHVNFSGADLSGVNFSAANLTGANLAGCILRNAKMRNATVTDADFRAVDFDGAVTDGVDFATAIMTSEDAEKRRAGATVAVDSTEDIDLADEEEVDCGIDETTEALSDDTMSDESSPDESLSVSEIESEVLDTEVQEETDEAGSQDPEPATMMEEDRTPEEPISAMEGESHRPVEQQK